jgi:hypothetical protein
MAEIIEIARLGPARTGGRRLRQMLVEGQIAARRQAQ